MNPISTNLKLPAKTKISNERQYVLSMFVEEINKARQSTKYKPLPPSAIAVKLSHIKTKELYEFYSVCKDANCFSKKFWFELKPR